MIRGVIGESTQRESVYQYDYTNQAWVRDGVYVACSHVLEAGYALELCQCFGRIHAGEMVLSEAKVY